MRDIVISFEPVVRARHAIIAAFLVATALAAPGLLRLRTDNSPEGFFVRDHDAIEAFRRLEDDFGRDHGLRVVIEGDRLWTPAALDAIGELELQLGVMDGGLGGVYATAGPARHHRWHLGGWPPSDAQALRRLALDDQLDRDAGWVGPNGDALTVIVGLFNMLPQRQALTLAAIDERMSALEMSLNALAPGDGEARVYAVGVPVVSRAVDRGQAMILHFVLPMLVLIAAGLLAILFRSVAGVLLPLALVAITQITAFGLIGYAGQRIDFVTSLLVPLTFVIALATGVHVLAYHRRLLAAGVAPRDAVVETYRVKAWPVLWTGVTTCAGFASLAVSGMPPVRALGLWTAFAIAFMTLAALSFYPALLGMVGARAAGATNAFVTGPQTLLRRWVHAAVQHRPAVYLGFGAIALVAALGLPRLRIDTGVRSYFPPSHPVRADIDRLEAEGLPAVSASLMIEAPDGSDGFGDPATLRRLAALTEELRTEPLVTGALSAGDLVADVARHNGAAPRTGGTAAPPGGVPATADLAAARRFMTTVPDLRDLLAAVLTENGESTRVVLFTPMRGFRELDPVYGEAEETVRAAFPDARVRLTGEYPLILAAQRSLLDTVVLSLLATFSVITLVMRILLRSTSLTVRSLLPNLWPVLLVLGVMGWAGIALDATTVMIAAVVLGLAVDDTLHTLGHLRLHVGAAADRDSAALVEESMAEVAGGHVITSVILCLGFLVPMASDLVPVARFGMLSAVAVAAALAADLLLVPALLANAHTCTLALLAPNPEHPGPETS